MADRMPRCPWPQETRHVLPSGLTVVCEQAPYPVTAVTTTYRAGFRDEDTDTTGMAHLIEHLMGRAARRTVKCTDSGAQIMAESRRDYSMVGAVVPGSHIDQAMRAGVVRPTELDASLNDIAVESALIEREYEELIEARPYGLFPRFLAARHLYDSIGEGGTGYGSPAMNQWLTPVSVTDFLSRHYTPARTVVTAVGDIAPSRMVDAAAEYFHGIDSAPEYPVPPVRPPLPRDRDITYRRPGVPDAVALAWRLPDPEACSRAHADRILCCNAAFAANGPVPRWLQSTAPGIQTRVWWGAFNEPWETRSGLGLIVELTGGRTGRLNDVSVALRRALPRLITSVDPAYLDMASAQMRLDLTRRFDHPVGRARMLGTREALFGEGTTWEDIWLALRPGGHDPSRLREVVDGTGCLFMRCFS